MRRKRATKEGSLGGRSEDWGRLILRAVVGLPAMYYGCQSLFGWFGGMGFSAATAHFEARYGVPPLLATLAMFAQFFGGLGLVLGIGTPLAALGVAAAMLGIAYVNLQQAGWLQPFLEGRMSAVHTIFLALAMAGAAAAVLALGSGGYALERRLFGGKKRR